METAEPTEDSKDPLSTRGHRFGMLCRPRSMGVPSGVGFLFHPIHRQRRYEGSREDIRGYHSKNHGLGQRRKEVLSDSRQEEDRHENNTDARSGNEGRYRDLGGPLQNGVQLRVSPSQVPIDVFKRTL